MEEEEDYFAPFGMSQFDFNSMVRRRNLTNLTQQLIEQGRVTLPGASAVSNNNTAQPADVEDDVENAPESTVTDDEDVARRSSSIYSRDIDEADVPPWPIPPRLQQRLEQGASTLTPQEQQQHQKAGHCPLEIDPWFYTTKPHSSDTVPRSLSSFPPVTSSRATSLDTYCSASVARKVDCCPPLPLQSAMKETLRNSITEPRSLYSSSFPATSWRSASVDTYCSGAAAPKAQYCPVQVDPWFYTTPRMPDSESHCMHAATRVIDKVRASTPMPPQEKPREHARAPELEASRERDMDLLKAMAALMRKFARQEQLQELQPPVDRIVELSRLRRAVRTLDFDFDGAIMLASDLTSLVPVPPVPGSQEVPETDDLVNVFKTHEWFRTRLARTVRRRVEALRNELRVGDALKIEHWYRDVINLVGWRDEDESRMSWSRLENDGFF